MSEARTERSSWVIFVAIAGVVVAMLFLSQRGSTGDAPSVDPSTGSVGVFRSLGVHDFGVVKGDQEIGHRFRVVNDTSETWTFVSSHVNCGCVRVESVTPSVAPGEELVVEATFASKGIGGEVQRSLQVTMAPEAKLFEAILTAKVLTPPHASPASLLATLGSREVDYVVYTEIVVPSQSDAVSVSGVGTGPDQRIDVRRTGVGDLGTTFFAEITGRLPLDQAELSERIFFTVEGSDMGSEVTVPILVRRTPDIEVSPRVVILHGNRPVEAHVMAKAGVEAVTCRVEPEGAGSARLAGDRLVVEARADSSEDAFRVLLTDSAGARTEVPVHVTSTAVIR